MKRIVFEGYLREMYPDGIEVCGDSAAECLSALQMYPGFRQEDEVRHTVVLPDFGSRDALCAKTSKEEIRVVPVVLAAGGSGFGQMIIGAILIVVGAYTGNATLIRMGATLLVSGVIQALMPQPNTVTSETDERSNYLGAGRNTTRIGTRIPLILGRVKVWGHYLAFNITASNRPAPVGAGAPAGGSTWQADMDYDFYHQGA